MEKAIVKTVGSKDDLIEIFWNFQGKKTDESLMMASITSGSYGVQYLDFDAFVANSKHFFRYAKCDKKYYKQLEYILENSNPKCIDYLSNILSDKWNIDIEFENLHNFYGME